MKMYQLKVIVSVLLAIVLLTVSNLTPVSARLIEYGGSASVRIAVYEKVGNARGKKTDERTLNATTDCVWKNTSSVKNALKTSLEKQFPAVTPSGSPAEVVFITAIDYTIDTCD